MPSANTSGSTLMTGAEQTLATIASAGTYVLVVDTAPMQSTDTLELRIYVKTLAGSVSRVAYVVSLSGVQSADDVIKISMPVPTTHEFKATMKQPLGSGRTFDWEIVQL